MARRKAASSEGRVARGHPPRPYITGTFEQERTLEGARTVDMPESVFMWLWRIAEAKYAQLPSTPHRSDSYRNLVIDAVEAFRAADHPLDPPPPEVRTDDAPKRKVLKRQG